MANIGIGHLGVVATGAAYTWPEPLMMTMTKPDAEGVPMTAEDMSWIMAVIAIGGVVGPIPVGYLAEWYGRKYITLSTGPICLLGWLMLIFTRSLPVLYAVRFLHGFAVAVCYTVNPIYIAETVEPGIRGAVSGIFMVAFYVGALYSFCIGPYVSYTAYTILAVPLPLIFTILFAFCPETPYWLLKHGKEEEAKKNLQWFRGNDNIEKVFDTMKEAVNEEMEAKGSWKTLFTDRYERKAFLLLQIVSLSKFLTGMSSIVTYATEIFAKSDSFFSASVMTIILGALLAGIGALSAVLSDLAGRKFLLIVSCFGCFIAHSLTTVYYYMQENTDIDARPYVWLMYVGLSSYCLFSDIGIGPLLTTLQAEMFGSKTREIAGAITETLGALLCFLVIKLYQPVSVTYGVYMNFLIYALTGLIGGVLISVLMYETKGKVIGRMEDRESPKPPT